MDAKVLQSASRGRASVTLLEIGAPQALFVVVMDVPCKRTGRRQHWSRTELELAPALELYECALADHVEEG